MTLTVETGRQIRIKEHKILQTFGDNKSLFYTHSNCNQNDNKNVTDIFTIPY